MVPTFYPRLVNGPFEDPSLFMDIRHEKRALLFDLGDVTALKTSKLMRISDIFVTHTHMDHFIGFDHLLRVLLGRDRILRIFGPTGIIRNVEGKLSAYTWNLVDEYNFSIEVNEIGEDEISLAKFKACEGFKKREIAATPWKGTIAEEPLFSVEAVFLDHRIPSLAFSIKEKFHININKDVLARLDYPEGSWLNQLKRDFREEKALSSSFIARWTIDGSTEERELRLGDFIENRLVILSRGQKITYVADAAGSPENREKIVRLAAGSDILFCEAAFLEEDAGKAAAKYHLTARETGEIARAAEVKRLEIFHFSPKYRDVPFSLYREALNAFNLNKQ